MVQNAVICIQPHSSVNATKDIVIVKVEEQGSKYRSLRCAGCDRGSWQTFVIKVGKLISISRICCDPVGDLGVFKYTRVCV